MKIIGVNGSPRPKGNTNAALSCMGEIFAQEGMAFEILHVGSKLSPCTGCFRCAKAHECTLPDDGLNGMYQKLLEADGIVFASPVYYASIASGMHCFMDRISNIASNSGQTLRFKVAAPLAIARRAGTLPAVDTLIHHINYGQMIIPGSLYWPIAFGLTPGEVQKDEEGLQTLQLLAQNMAYLIKVMAAGREQVPLPPVPRKCYTNLIR